MKICSKTNKHSIGQKSILQELEDLVSSNRLIYNLAALSNHTSVVYKGKMYLFGGSLGLACNPSFYALDLHKFIWEIVRTKSH